MKELIFFYNHPQINGSKKIQTTNKLQSQSYKWLGFNGFFFFFHGGWHLAAGTHPYSPVLCHITQPYN